MRAILKAPNGRVIGTVDGSIDTILANCINGVNYTLLEDTELLPSLGRQTNINYAKAEVESKVSQILVTTISGKVFDGDEKSQDRMVRAVNIAGITGAISTQWKLADNTISTVTLDELKEALALAGQTMSTIWLEN